jgi:hypothetical protein
VLLPDDDGVLLLCHLRRHQLAAAGDDRVFVLAVATEVELELVPAPDQHGPVAGAVLGVVVVPFVGQLDLARVVRVALHFDDCGSTIHQSIDQDGYVRAREMGAFDPTGWE